MKKYLVTGGAGFIGANFVKYIAGRYGRECEIVILDKLTYAGHVENIAEELKLPNVRLVVGDICDRNLVETLLDSFDPNYIVNFAAESHVDRSISDPRPFLETNIMGTQKRDSPTANSFCRFQPTRYTAHWSAPSRPRCP